MLSQILMASVWSAQIWYAVPLILVISLVYGATRHELIRPILEHAVRFAAWMLCFMSVLFVVLWVVSWTL